MDTEVHAAGLGGAQAASRSDEKIWAALAHGSAVLMFIGPLVPLLMWTMQRKKSPYATLQALQALIYQSLIFWIWITMVPFFAAVFVLGATILLVAADPGAQRAGAYLVGIQLAMFAIIFGGLLLYIAVGIAGAVACLMGREFRYPFFGGRLARSLAYQGAEGPAMPEDRQDHVVAAACHASLGIILWGLITPVVAWITEHERSAYLSFQALQAAIYQALGTVAYFAVMALYMLSFFAFAAAAVSLRPSSDPNATLAFAAAMIPFLCVGCGTALALPLYHLFGFLGAVNTLKGREFRYPILGRLLASRMKPAERKP